MRTTCFAVLGPAILALLGFSAVPQRQSEIQSPAAEQVPLLYSLNGSPELKQYTEPVRQLHQPDLASLVRNSLLDVLPHGVLGGVPGRDGSGAAILLLGTAFLGIAQGLRRRGLRQARNHIGNIRNATDFPFPATPFQLRGGSSC